MLVFEAKLEGEKLQYERLDEAIRTARCGESNSLANSGLAGISWD